MAAAKGLYLRILRVADHKINVCADRVRQKTERKSVYRALYSEIRGQQHFRCDACRKPWERVFQIDHIVPLAIGGSNERDNLHMLCPDCHARKTAMEPALASVVARFGERPGLRYALCYLCGDIVSLFFQHRCTKPQMYRRSGCR